MLRQRSDLFTLRHRGSSLHPSQDHCLAYPRKGIFRPQGRGRSAEAGHPRSHVVWDFELIQSVHLLPDRTENARVSGMQTHGHPVLSFSPPDGVDDFFQRHYGTVQDPAVGTAAIQQLWINQASCINHLIRTLQQRSSAQCDQIRCSGSRSDKVNHFIPPDKKNALGNRVRQRQTRPTRLSQHAFGFGKSTVLPHVSD